MAATASDDNMTLSHRSVFLIPRDTGQMSIAKEFATAKYSLSKNQLKAWYLFIASMDEHHVPEQGTMYSFDALRFADKLNIDARKARGMIVAELFTKLSQNYIDLRSREDSNGEQDIYHANFISELSYNRRTHILNVSIPPRLNQYLFNLKEGTYITMDIEDILALDTIVSMRIFIYLRNLDRMDIHEIPIDQFRQEIDLYPESSYKEFKRKVINSSIEEIHRHTSYKEFFIEDDGAAAVRLRPLSSDLLRIRQIPTHTSRSLPLLLSERCRRSSANAYWSCSALLVTRASILSIYATILMVCQMTALSVIFIWSLTGFIKTSRLAKKKIRIRMADILSQLSNRIGLGLQIVKIRH